MAYTGRAPSQAPITSADINDGIIVPADLSTGAPSWDASGNLDVTGTVTADGLGLDASVNSAITFENQAGTTADASIATFDDANGTLLSIGSNFYISNAGAESRFNTGEEASGIVLNRTGTITARTSDGSNNTLARLNIANNGDISFYEDTGSTPKFFWDASAERLRIGSTALTAYTAVDDVVIEGPASVGMSLLAGTSSIAGFFFGDSGSSTKGQLYYDNATDSFTMLTNATSNSGIVIDSSGNLLVGKDSTSGSTNGLMWISNGNNSYLSLVHNSTNSSLAVQYINRQSSDGYLLFFQQADSNEGGVSVSGTTVSYNGGHLSRWSQLPDSSRDESIVKGTVMTNLDAMCEWSHADEYWTEEDELPVDEEGNPTAAVGDLKKAAYTEDNEQLNRMVVSSVEGDPNVAGVFVNWDNDDDEFNDMNIAMTGDMVIRIAQGTTVARGDLLMSAGDGTAKPQGDDIVRSKTIAKVTSTNVSHTYDDGSYLVPCVLMAC